MRLKKNDDSYLDLKITNYEQNIRINYKLVETSGSNILSIDRGALTDRYSSTVIFRGHKDYIREIVSEITLLRTNGKELVLDQFNENIFGDNVDYSGAINCLVDSFGKENSPTLNIQSIELVLLPTNLTFVGTSQLPTSLNCLYSKWEGYSDWNAHVNETYTRNNYFVDREADTYVFEGDYSLTIDENTNLLSFWKQQRGDAFTINDGDFGTSNMFGPVAGTGAHSVIILNIEYDRFGPVMRSTTIKLVKVG